MRVMKVKMSEKTNGKDLHEGDEGQNECENEGKRPS